MSKICNTEKVVKFGILKTMSSFVLTILVIHVLLGHLLNGKPMIVNIMIMISCAGTMIPLLIISPFVGFVKLFSGKLKYGLPFDGYQQLIIYITIVSLLTMMVAILPFLCIRSFMKENYNVATGLLVLLSISVMGVCFLVRVILTRLTDPTNLPSALNRNLANRLLKESVVLAFIGALCMTLMFGGIYVLAMETLYSIGIVSLICVVPVYTLLSKKVHQVVQNYDLPSQVEVIGIMRFFMYT